MTKNKKNSPVNTSNEQLDTLIVHGTKYKTNLSKKYRNRKKWEMVDEKQEVSYIPGTIKELYARNGEPVKKDQPILVLEAMKMENTIFAPFDGEILKVNVEVGQIVPKGYVMIEYA